MKTKYLVAVLSFVVVLLMTVGCGHSRKNYENDMEVLNEMSDIDIDRLIYAVDKEAGKDIAKELKKEVKALDFSTKEGKAIRNAVVDFIKILGEMNSAILEIDEEGTDRYDAYLDILNEFEEKIKAAQEKVEDAITWFRYAAEKAGV
ncbi:MAG: hypothetical protein E7260_02995 [Lachnospiraceae bacterium]|nr:hypothetical protein [Lachnospiraceae bacterium]